MSRLASSNIKISLIKMIKTMCQYNPWNKTLLSVELYIIIQNSKSTFKLTNIYVKSMYKKLSHKDKKTISQ
jgi:flagellar motor switch protein FliM